MVGPTALLIEVVGMNLRNSMEAYAMRMSR